MMMKRQQTKKRPVQRLPLRNGVVARVPRSIAFSSNPDNGIPLKRTVTLAYGGHFALAGGANLYAAQVFRMNGMYDPDETGGGHQPRGFDQLVSASGPYTRFTVTRCEVTAVFKNGTADIGFVGILAGNYAVATDDVDTITECLERSNIVWKQVMPTGQTGQNAQLSASYDVAQFMGRPNILYDTDLAGSSAADPADQAHVMVFIVTPAVAPSAYVDVQLKYTAVLHGRATPAAS
jgi:hypothetical protein